MNWHVHIHRAIPFDKLEQLQEDLYERVRKNPNEAHLLVSEPLPTYTAGRAASENELKWTEAFCTAKGIQLVRVSRGGKWTYHGPDQIVVYPICHLPSMGYGSRAVRPFLEDFRNSIANHLTHHGISNICRDDPYGIYVADQKIASFGIQVRHGIVLHGVALYYGDQNPMLAGIHPCGVTAARYTSMKTLGWGQDWDQTAQEVLESIKKGFKKRGKWIPLTTVQSEDSRDFVSA